MSPSGEPKSGSGIAKIPQTISSCPHSCAARASVCSTFTCDQSAMFDEMESDELIVGEPERDLALCRLQ
jgi:hypothetical protein